MIDSEMKLKTLLLVIDETSSDYAIFIYSDRKRVWDSILEDMKISHSDFTLEDFSEYKEYSYAKHNGQTYRILDAVEVV